MITLLIHLLRRAYARLKPDPMRRDEKPWPPGGRCPDVTITFVK